MKLMPEILSHPHIPKPLHGINPRSIYGQEWWDKTRKEAYASTDHHCIACGVHKNDAKYHTWLEAHENYDINYKTGDVKLISIIPLCHSCHNFIHSGLMTVQLHEGKITQAKLKDIIQHGCNILSDNNLKGFSFTVNLAYKLDCVNIPDANDDPDETATWGMWNLELDGKKYYSKFKNYNEWLNYKWR